MEYSPCCQDRKTVKYVSDYQYCCDDDYDLQIPVEFCSKCGKLLSPNIFNTT